MIGFVVGCSLALSIAVAPANAQSKPENDDGTASIPTMRVEEESPTPTPAPAAPKPTASEDETRTSAPISAEDILKEFERERPVAEPVLPRPRPGETVVRESMPGDAPDVDLPESRARFPDGYILADRAGRLVREGEWWVITFVADNHPDTRPEPPMKILPNRMLERMVRESEAATRSVEFIVSGEVTDFLGENYLLLRKLMRKRDMGNLSH
jgi:hypothetical protein